MTNAERTPRQIRLLTALLLFGTFLSGAVAGAGFYRFTSGQPSLQRHRPPAPFLPGPPGALKLTPEQEAKAGEITGRYRPKLEALLLEGFPKIQAINDQMEGEMRQILTAEQVRKLDELKAQRPPMPPFGPPGNGGPPSAVMPPGMPGPGGQMLPPPWVAPPLPPSGSSGH